MATTARDVTAGSCNPRINNPAGPGPDLATGAGLVDAAKAVLIAKVRSQQAPAGVPLNAEDVALLERMILQSSKA